MDDNNKALSKRVAMHLLNYDYSQEGLYFVTICTNKRECMFGWVENDKMFLNDAGKMIESRWLSLNKYYSNIQLHDFIVMPNHFHAIVEIIDKNKSLIEIIAGFKSITTNSYIKGVKEYGWTIFDRKLWQRNFHDHVIRNIESLEKITKYIKYNPDKWCDDKYFI